MFVRLLRVPGLTLEAAFGSVHFALVVSAIALDTGGCKKTFDIVMNRKSLSIFLLVAKSYLISVIPDLVQVAFPFPVAILGNVLHSGSRK